MTSPPPPSTAYAEEAAWLKQWLLRGQPDARALARPLTRCDLVDCKGLCCYAGVAVRPETAERLASLAQDEASFFRSHDLALPDPPIEKKGFWFLSVRATRVRPHPFSRLVPGFPKHFKDTACVFMVADGRCSLELLSIARGKHRWHFKPIACALQPLKLGTTTKISLTLPDAGTDPSRRPGFPGYVTHCPCGATAEDGFPAAGILKPELSWLQAITGVNILWVFADE